MKTNSKLYKRVLAIALAVCMLCSVLVTGIGAGLKAKAEATTETKSFTNDWSWSYSKDNDTNYTTTYGCDAFKSYFDGYTWTGSEKVTVSFKYAGLHEGCSYTLGVFILNGSYSGINYTETVTEDGTANLNLDATWLKDSTAISTCQAEIYVPIADKANLDGVTLSDVTFTVEGIVVDDTTTEDGGEDTTTHTATIKIDDSITRSGEYVQFQKCNGAEVWTKTVKDGENVIAEVAGSDGAYTFTWDSTAVESLTVQVYVNSDNGEFWYEIPIANEDALTVYYDSENNCLTTTDPNKEDEPTIEVPAAGITANTDGSVDLDAVYCVQNTDTWSGGEVATEFTGWGTYTFVNHQNWTSEVPLNNYFKVPNLYKYLIASGYTDEQIKEQVTLSVEVEIDGEVVANAPYNVSFEKVNETDENYSNVSFQTWNPWGSDAQKAVLDAISSYIKVTMTINGPEITVTELPEEEEPEEEETKPNVKENGYVHDKGAIFVYTGSKYDIHDFVFAGYALAQIHRDAGSWGDWYEDFTKTSQNGFAPLRGNGIYIRYWDDYKGIGYPAVQLSWDTDRIHFFGLLLRSNDWTYQHDYSFNNDGFFRNEKFYTEAILDGSDRWYYFAEANYDSATEDTTTQNPVPTTEGAINVTGDGEYYTFLAIGADNNKEDWHYSWAGVQKAEEEDDKNKLPPAGMTVEAVNAKIGEQFTVSVKTETPVAYTWYVAPTIVVGADKTAVDAKVVAVRIDGKDVTDTINFAADEKTWWYEDTGIYNKANNDNKDVAARLAGGYNEWGTKYIAESPAGYTSIEYDIIINGIA